MNDIRKYIRRAERGDGGSFAFVAYTPYLFFLMLFGVIIGLLGFYRVATVTANERGTYSASVTNDISQGQGTQRSVFQTWVNASSTGGLTTDIQQVGRSAIGRMSSNRTATVWQFGSVDNSVVAQAQRRWERFYAGPPACPGTVIDGTCRE
jgi:hypothetical protein